MTTKRYPYTLAQALEQIRICSAREPNTAIGALSYRNSKISLDTGLLAFSFIESPRTPGAYRESPYAS